MGDRSRTVLVTGARGFTGLHLRRELEAAGYTVIGLVNDGATSRDEVFADLSDPAALRAAVHTAAPELVVHLAAQSFVGHGDTAGFYRTNALGTFHLLQSLCDLSPRPAHVILASSANVYGDTAGDAIDECQPSLPVNHYAASKVAMEAVATVFRSELPITVPRPFNYTGPGQSTQFLVPKIVDHFARRAATIELGNLDVVRDFLDVRVVASIYRKLLESKRGASQVVNVCSGQGIEIRGVVARLERITGHRIEVLVNPAFVRKNDVRRLIGSNRKLIDLIGELPIISFEQTLRDMLGHSQVATTQLESSGRSTTL